MLWGGLMYRRWLIASFLCLPLLASADVTYNGSDGVKSQIFNVTSSGNAATTLRCMDCHSSSASDLLGGSRNSAPDEVDFDTYTNATAIPSYWAADPNGRNAIRANVRIADGSMPPAGALSQAKIDLMAAWIAGSYPEHAQPDVVTVAASSVTKYSATLNANVNDNGINTTYLFNYGLSPADVSSSTVSLASSGTGGGLSSVSISTVISGLTCNTTYYFRGRSNANGTYSSGVGSTFSFTTAACPTITSTPNTGAVINSPYTYDVNGSGGITSFSLASAPDEMTINNLSGVIEWTPPESAAGSVDVTVLATDGVTETSQTFTINVAVVSDTPQNDSPYLGAVSDIVITELAPLSLPLTVADSDDANDGSGALIFTLQGSPAGIVVSSTGVIEGMASPNTAGQYAATIQVADGGEDGSSPASRAFSITVLMLDSDGDSLADYNDNCPFSGNLNQANNDGDAQGDVCDTDDDNDGLPDSIELARGLDPFDPSDAAGDLDGDGISNLDEYLGCVAANDPICDAIAVDSVAPVITTNGDLTVAATGYVTAVGETATAEDGVDGTVAVSADVRGPFRPGRHVITWTAQDAAGNVATAEQTVRVLPHVDIASALMVGEDELVRLPILLSGPAPDYPLHLIYTVSGTAGGADHTLAGGSIAVAAGESGYLEFLTLPDAVTEGDETIVVTATAVSANGVLGAHRRATITIVDRPVAPQLTLQMRQGGDISQYIFADMGEVVVTALASDANGDVLSYDWQFSDDSISYSTEANVLRFDPATVAAGAYRLTVTVSDADHDVSQILSFVLQTEAPVLLDSEDSDDDGVDDLAEGLQDSDSDGVLDYLDPVLSAHQLQINVAGADRLQRLLQTEAGLQLRLGQHAMSAQRRGARVSSSELRDADGAVIVDPRYDAIGEIYDFEVSGLSEVQPIARVVLPLAQSLPPEATYRKLINGSWQSFVMIDDDDIYSAPLTAAGLCPSLDDDSWRIGLNRSDRCVRLRMRDGGRNDADGVGNGVVADPGVIAVAKAGEPEAEPTEGPNGGGGAMTIAGALAGLLLLAWRRRKTGEYAA